jgi:hypothetical protein
MLLAWSILENPIGFVNAEKTNSASDGLKPVDQKECIKDDHNSICKDLETKGSILSAGSSNDTTITSDNMASEKKLAEPFILPFP